MKKVPISSNKSIGTGHFVLLLILCVQVVYGQDKPIDFQFSATPLKLAIDELIADHDMAIAYRSNQVKGIRISATCEQCTPEGALDEILRTTNLRWEKTGGKQFILIQKEGKSSLLGKVYVEDIEHYPGGIQVNLVRIDENGNSLQQETVFTAGDGGFSFKKLFPGSYQLTVQESGYKPYTHPPLELDEAVTLEVRLGLELEVSIPVMNIEVHHKYDLIRDEPMNFKLLNRRQIEKLPSFGNDIARSVEHLAGVSNGDLSATIQIRGGEERETKVIYDGITLDEPFHFKDVFSGLLSIVDPEIVGRVELLTAGMPIEEGNYMSGIFNIHPVQPREQRNMMELTTISAKFKHEGVFDGGRGDYVIAGREGIFYEDIILTEFTETISDTSVDTNVDYTGLYGRVSYRFDRHELAAGTIQAWDAGKLEEKGFDEDDLGVADTEGRHETIWVKHSGHLTDNLMVSTQLVDTGFDRQTITNDNLGVRRFTINDFRDYHRAGIRQDWIWSLGERHIFKWGGEYWDEDIDMDYSNNRRNEFAIPVPLLIGNVGETIARYTSSEHRYGLYVGDRIKITPRLTLETGIRYDRQSHTDEEQWSPRIHSNWTLGTDRKLRVGWGRYHQPQALYQLQIQDGITQYNDADFSDQWVLSYEEQFLNGLYLRTDLFHKDYRINGPRFINFLDPHNSFPEAQADRVVIFPEHGRGRGLEITFSQRIGNNLGWMANYTLSEIFDLVDGEKLYRYYDQRHAVNLAFEYSLGENWSMNLAWHFHNGWRTTDVGVKEVVDENGTRGFETVVGPYYVETFPNYHRIDMRFQRKFQLAGTHALGLYVEITNLLSRDNIQNTGDHLLFVDIFDRPVVTNDQDTWVPQTANFGFRWNFK